MKGIHSTLVHIGTIACILFDSIYILYIQNIYYVYYIFKSLEITEIKLMNPQVVTSRSLLCRHQIDILQNQEHSDLNME